MAIRLFGLGPTSARASGAEASGPGTQSARRPLGAAPLRALLALALLLVSGLVVADRAAAEPLPQARGVIVVKFDDQLNYGGLSLLRRAIGQAQLEGTDLVVVLDTPGGEVGLMYQIGEALRRARDEGVQTVAFVDRRALSAGVLVAMSCDLIYMAPGSVIGANHTVCDECERTRSEKKISKFYRTWQIQPDAEKCLLEQGLLCCGPATRAGCDANCPKVNSPCIGCYGPNDGVADYGARLMSAVASVIDSDDPDEIDRIIEEGIPDPVGSFYRFSLASSLLRRSKLEKN